MKPTYDKLQEEVEKNSAIIASIADGVIVSDTDGHVTLFNTAAERILGLPREQVVGQPLSGIMRLYGNEETDWAQTIQDRTQGAALDASQEDLVDERLMLGDKGVNAHLSSVYVGEKFLGMLFVFRDITREVELERRRSKFISNIAFELRTPLTTAKGYSDLILLEAMGDLSEQQKRGLSIITENLDRLAAAIVDMLEVSQIDSDSTRLNIETVSIENTFRSVLTSLQQRPQHQRKIIEVAWSVEPAGLTLQADAYKLYRVLHNLIDNAFSYTPSGGRVDIQAKLLTNEQRILFSISDTGIGIPEAYRSAIWNRFQRVNENVLKMGVDGTGLGLSIVKGLVEMHSGEVWFDSEVGKGSTFYVSMPLTPPEYPRKRF